MGLQSAGHWEPRGGGAPTQAWARLQSQKGSDHTKTMDLELLPEKGWGAPPSAGSQQDPPSSYFEEMETAFSREGRVRETTAGGVRIVSPGLPNLPVCVTGV